MKITIFVHTSSLQNLNDFLNLTMAGDLNRSYFISENPIVWKKFRDSLNIKDEHMFVEVQLSYDDFIVLSDHQEYEL